MDLRERRTSKSDREMDAQAAKRAQVFLDRGATLVLASLEVGPSIKALVAHTNVPSYVVNAASWYMRRAGLWSGQNRSAQRVHYDWQRALEAGDDEAGQRVMQDAAVAVGQMQIDSSGGRKVYEPGSPWATRNTGGRFKLSIIDPPCASTLALGRHHLFNEHCATCEVAAQERHRVYAERMERVRADREMRQSMSEQREQQEAAADARYRVFVETEARELAGKHNEGRRNLRRTERPVWCYLGQVKYGWMPPMAGIVSIAASRPTMCRCSALDT